MKEYVQEPCVGKTGHFLMRRLKLLGGKKDI
jgi:hypothetical protein